MRDYVHQQLKSHHRRASNSVISAAGSVLFPADIHLFVDDHIYTHFGNPGIMSLPQERHLVNLTSEPYHIRRIPHSLHNKLLSRGNQQQQQRRRALLKNSLSFAVATAANQGVIDGDGPGVADSGGNLLMTHAGLVGGFNIDETYKFKVERMAFRDSLIRKVRKWIDAYKQECREQQRRRDELLAARRQREGSAGDDESSDDDDGSSSVTTEESESVVSSESSTSVVSSVPSPRRRRRGRRDDIMSNIILSDSGSVSDFD